MPASLNNVIVTCSGLYRFRIDKNGGSMKTMKITRSRYTAYLVFILHSQLPNRIRRVCVKFLLESVRCFVGSLISCVHCDKMASRSEIRGDVKHVQGTSKIVSEKIPSHLSSKHQGKMKKGKTIDSENKIKARLNGLRHSGKDHANELVKHMSKVPDYLQHEEKIVGTVLNVGVLGWGRLGKWKLTQKGGQATDCNNVLCSGPKTSRVVPKDSRRCKINVQFTSSNLNQINTSRDRCIQESEMTSRDPFHSSFSSDMRSQIPQPCPLSLDFKNSESIMVPLDADLSSDLCAKELFGRDYLKTASSRICEFEKVEDESRRSLHPSGKRFGFSFSGLGRSLSFKEELATQAMNSDVCMGSRANPLRWLLDPFLKPMMNNKELRKDESARNMSTTRALIQLTSSQGFPIFQFSVDDKSRSVLVATMKSLASSTKDDSAQYCNFYSLDRIKKKRSGWWLMQGSAERQRGFVYNIVGQMRLSNYLTSDSTDQKSGNKCPVRESVLFESELNQSERESKELAAVVIKRGGENEGMFGLATVILPRGAHSFPDRGGPSPLIDRWRSGGSCDCGGWDVGCNLKLLSNQNHEFPQIFQLFDEDGPEQKLPAVTMIRMKRGMEKVEYRSGMSPLQAFFICLSVITWCESGQQPSCRGMKDMKIGVRRSSFNPPLSPAGRV